MSARFNGRDHRLVCGTLCLALMPFVASAAIQRHRLYDLDRIISRTVFYGMVTVVLGAGYAAVVPELSERPLSTTLRRLASRIRE